MITNTVVDDLYERYSHLFCNFNQPWLSPENLLRYATAIHDKGAALDNCWGFLDGTVRPICRPMQNQGDVYNGHKRLHALKFQSVMAPNGLIANLFGPIEGKRHDSRMLTMSGLLDKLQEHSYSPTGVALCLYGDSAYPHRVHLQHLFSRRGALTINQQEFNRTMTFGDIAIGLSAVGKFYVICALLRNALTCLYGNTTSTFFEIAPPNLNAYLQ
jgi:hypothetical protein